MGITAKKKVELEGEPSYTSIDHKWKGAIPNLNNRLTNINIKANWIKLPLRKRCLVKVYEENSFTLSDSKSIKKKRFFKSSKLTLPLTPYKIEDPNRNKLDEKAPKIKYFKPASTEKAESFFIDAMI